MLVIYACFVNNLINLTYQYLKYVNIYVRVKYTMSTNLYLTLVKLYFILQGHKS